MSEPRVAGHCLCREVAFEFTGKPNWTVHCHCESCRRATSSPMTTWVSVPRSAFRFVRGVPRNYSSSPGVKRGFCERCGSPLTYENERMPDEIHLLAASLVDPSEVRPERHVFVGEQLGWFDTADHLPRYATTKGSGAPPIRSAPKAL